jgi:hypothetical protein
MLFRLVDESDTFDPDANTIVRTLVASDDWTVINTTDLTGEQLRILLDPAQLVGDLKSEVAKKMCSSSASQIMVVVNGNAAEDSMTIAELLASAANSPIYCWQKVEATSSETVDFLSERSASTNPSSDLVYSIFSSIDFRNLEETAAPKLFEMLQGMQQQIADLEERDLEKSLIIESHEKEVSSLRKSLARCAETLHENPGSIFGKSAATLAERVRSMLADVRVKRKNASIQLQRVLRGHLVRNSLRDQATEATNIQAAWRGLPPRQKLAGLLQAIRQMQRIHRGRMVRKDICHQAANATKIQAVGRSHTGESWWQCFEQLVLCSALFVADLQGRI